MEYTDKEFCLEVWGNYACFSRPELKVERVSYDVITPSAARAIFEAIFWKPTIRWEITKIEVLNPIKWENIRRNELGAVASVNSLRSLYIEKNRQQRNSLLLKDVHYRIYAKLVFIPIRERVLKAVNLNKDNRNDENPMKYYEMFTRRASNGQCFNQPYLGTREFSCFFKLVTDTDNNLKAPIPEDKDLGIMLYDLDFSNKKNITAMFYHVQMTQGVIIVPPYDSKNILR